MEILLILIAIISIFIAIYCINSKIKVDKQISLQKKELKEENNQLVNTNTQYKEDAARLKNQLNTLNIQIEYAQNEIKKETDRLNSMKVEVDNVYIEREVLNEKAYNNYFTILENKYKDVEVLFDAKVKELDDNIKSHQTMAETEISLIQKELDKIKATRAAAIEALLREKENEENISFYCIELSDSDKADIAKLETLKPSLNKPRVLSMLIWQTWFQKPLRTLSANILGTSDKTGIYKITNIKTKECYIGQAVSIKDRWVEHVKCGLGIDTPQGNKLYKAMQEYGVWNFSFEILEECPRDQLNEKEKFFIDLYDSYNYGYYLTRGNK